MISRTDKFHLEHPLVFTPITAFTLLLLSQRDDVGEVRGKQLGTMDLTSNQFELVMTSKISIYHNCQLFALLSHNLVRSSPDYYSEDYLFVIRSDF